MLLFIWRRHFDLDIHALVIVVSGLCHDPGNRPISCSVGLSERTLLLDLLMTSLSDLPLSGIPSCYWALLLCQVGWRKLFSSAVRIIVGGKGTTDLKRGGQGTVVVLKGGPMMMKVKLQCQKYHWAVLLRFTPTFFDKFLLLEKLGMDFFLLGLTL